MAADDLPTEYDDIVIGTGIQESILAAALARIGHRVLHLDRNDYYSGEWASFHLKGILEWIDKTRSHSPDDTPPVGDAGNSIPPPSQSGVDLQEGEQLILVSPRRVTVSHLQATKHVREQPEPLPESPGGTDRTGDQSQSFNSSNQNDTEEQQSSDQSDQNACSSSVPGADVESLGPQDEEQHQSSRETVTVSQDGEHPTVPVTVAIPQGVAEETQSSECQEGGTSPNSLASGNESESCTEVNQSPDDQPEGQESNAQEGGQNAGQGVMDNNQAAPREAEERRREWTWEDISKGWRKFNIDLAPKLVFCRGSMVELLVSSRISRYAEFKAVTRILTHINGKLEQVPCSRADVFSSRYVSVLEKRMLMRLIEFCLDHENRQDEYRDYITKPFVDFLKSRKLTRTLQHFVIHSIAMVTEDIPTEQALQAMQYFLRSLGRYGNTAFLWTMYGSGELPQCFCRMCAVFAGIYILRTSITNMITDAENTIKGIVDTEGRRLTCRNLIMEYSYVPLNASSTTPGFVSRGILITDRSLKQSDTEQITLLTIPPLEGTNTPVHVIEVGYAACATPRELFLVHLTCKNGDQTSSAIDDLNPILERFFQVMSEAESGPMCSKEEEDKPRILWSLFFTREDVTGIPDEEMQEGLPGNVHVTSGAGASVGFEHAVAQAKRIFERLCPGEEFLPAAPEPDDLVFEDPTQDNPGHSQAGFDEQKGDSEEKGISESEKKCEDSDENKAPAPCEVLDTQGKTEEQSETIPTQHCEDALQAEEAPTPDETL